MTKLKCSEVLDQLWEYLDEDARAELTSQINDHLGGCRDCRAEVDSLKRTISLYKCEDAVGTPILLSERVQAALQAAYREAEKLPD